MKARSSIGTLAIVLAAAMGSAGAASDLSITTAGGSGGASWDDRAKCAAGPVTGVNISAGKSVDRVRFAYGDSYAWADPHGGSGGSEQTFYLPKGEYITSVQARWTDEVTQLTFSTNKGHTFGPYGGGAGQLYPGIAAGKFGQILGCLSGRAGARLDQLAFSFVNAPPGTTSAAGSPAAGGAGGSSSNSNCTPGASATGSGSVSGSNVQGGASVGVGMSCSTSVGYADPNGYIAVTLTCQSGMYASAQGQAGSNGVALCADASVGSSCTAAVGGAGTSQYGGGGGSAGVSDGNATGGGLCGGVTFTGGTVKVSMCGTLAFEVGVDVCIDGSVNYKNIYNRIEPFASRALAQASKCAASNTAANRCAFTMGDLMANAAGPYIGRSAQFFDSARQFNTTLGKDVWKDAKAANYRSTSYVKASNKFVGNNLQNTAYNASGEVLGSTNQIVDTGKKSVEAANKFFNKAGDSVKDFGNDIGNGIKNLGK